MEKQRVRVSELTPGMKLAENITNESGMTLMPMGVRLTPMFISRLEKWNVASVLVVIEDREEDDENEAHAGQVATADAKSDASIEQQEFLKAVTTDVGTWFLNVRDNPLMLQLRSIAIKKLLADGPRGRLVSLRGPVDASGEKAR